MEANDKNIVETNAIEKSDINVLALEEIKSLKEKLAEASKVSETLKKEKESVESEKVKLLEARKQDAIARYTEKAKAKGIEVKDLSNANMEMIQFATDMVDEYKASTLKEESVEEKTEKVKAQFKTKEIASVKEDVKLNNLMIESASKGYALFYNY